MYEEILKKAGLTSVQTEIYGYLLSNGEFKASTLAQKIKRPRGVVYKGLEELINLNLVGKRDDENMVSLFKAEHPGNLEQLYLNEEKKAKENKNAYAANLSNFISIFNLTNNKPGVLYYEGREGIKNALDHITKNFREDREILSFVKVLPDKYEANIKGAFDHFIKKRIKLNVKTRVLALDTPEGKTLQDNDEKALRETKLVNNESLPLQLQGGELFVYRNEICAISMENNVHFAFIVQNNSMAQLFRAFFESLWRLLPDKR